MIIKDETLCVQAIKKIMEIFGGKWSFVIIGELHTGPQYFNELRRNIGINTKSLSDALKSLESNGVITRTVYSTSPIKVEYALTEKGYDFENIFVEMKEWGMKWLEFE